MQDVILGHSPRGEALLESGTPPLAVERRKLLDRFVCSERLVGAQSFTDDELRDPILRGRDDLRNPCDRRGPLSPAYHLRLPRSLWNDPRASLAASISRDFPDSLRRSEVQ